MLSIILACVMTLVFTWTVVSVFIIKRLSLRLLQFDNMYENVVDDIVVYSDYLDEFIEKSTFSNSPDIIALNRNVVMMKKRLDTYVESYRNITKLSPRKEKPQRADAPVVVD